MYMWLRAMYEGDRGWIKKFRNFDFARRIRRRQVAGKTGDVVGGGGDPRKRWDFCITITKELVCVERKSLLQCFCTGFQYDVSLYAIWCARGNGNLLVQIRPFLKNGSRESGYLPRGGGLGSRPKKMYGERLGDGVEYHSMKPTPRR